MSFVNLETLKLSTKAKAGFKMNESELYKELGVVTKNRSKWKESIPFVSSLLNHESIRVLCTLGG